MNDWIAWAYGMLTSLPVRCGLRLVPAQPPISGSIFGFADYLAALALLLVVLMASDFRYQFRMAVARHNLRRIGFFIGLAVGFSVLLVDVWFQNQLPIPVVLSNSNNLKAALGLIFLAFVFRVFYVTIMGPQIFRAANAEAYFRAAYHYIHEGHADRLQVIAEEVAATASEIVSLASIKTLPKRRRSLIPPWSYAQARAALKRRKTAPEEYARSLLLLLGDSRFCKTLVDRAPSSAFSLFVAVQRKKSARLPIFQFARNVGREFISNKGSAFYQEDSGFYSGYLGYAKPATRIIFGDYDFVEACAADGASPLDSDYRDDGELDPAQLEAFNRAGLSFLESYLKKTRGRAYPHSYALARLMSSYESAVTQTYKLDGLEDFIDHASYARLKTAVRFINDAIKLTEKHAYRPKTVRMQDHFDSDIYDELARLIFKVVMAAASVKSPIWTAWAIQHNTVWSSIFGLHDSDALKIIRKKVRRLMYDEIEQMDDFANFSGARVLGFALHVFGLTPIDRHTGFRKKDFAIQAKVLQWTRKNYARLVRDHPKVAAACLHGSIEFDARKRSLIRTHARDTEKNPRLTELKVDAPPRRKSAASAVSPSAATR